MVKEMRIKKQIEDMKQWVKVSKEEYEEFIANYPSELVYHSIYFCSPPIHGHYDFSLNPIGGGCSFCMVAEYTTEKECAYGIIKENYEEEYSIVKNIEEVRAYVEEIRERIGN